MAFSKPLGNGSFDSVEDFERRPILVFYDAEGCSIDLHGAFIH